MACFRYRQAHRPRCSRILLKFNKQLLTPLTAAKGYHFSFKKLKFCSKPEYFLCPKIFQQFEKSEVVFLCCSFSDICVCGFFEGFRLIESSVFSCKLYLFPVCVPWVCFDWMSVEELRSKCSRNTVIVATSSSSLCQHSHYTGMQAAQSCQTLLYWPA